MPKVYSYIRMSHPSQMKGDSLRRQLELSQEYAKEHNLTLDTSLKLHDIGVSAYHSGNIIDGKLGAFLKAIDEGKVEHGSVLLIESLDRISRDKAIKSLGRFIDILSKGITIVSLVDNQTYTYETMNEFQLVWTIMELTRAHNESLMKSKRLSAVWENKRQRALHGHILTERIPAWLKKEGDKVVPIPERVAIVKQIFDLCISGHGSVAIAKSLHKEQTPAWAGKRGWHLSYIQKILHSRAVLGEFQPHKRDHNNKRVPIGDPLPKYYPQVIDNATFYRAQSSLKGRKNKGGRIGNDVPNLFTHVAKCGKCGYSMIVLRKGIRSSGPRLVCDGARRGVGCEYKAVAYKGFEQALLQYIKELDLPSLLHVTNANNQITELTHETDSKQAELREIATQITRLTDAIAKTNAEPEPIIKRITELEQQHEQLTQQIEQITKKREQLSNADSQTQANSIEINDAIDHLQELRGDALRNARLVVRDKIRSIIEQIRVYPKLPLGTGVVVEFRMIDGRTKQRRILMRPHKIVSMDIRSLTADEIAEVEAKMLPS